MKASPRGWRIDGRKRHSGNARTVRETGPSPVARPGLRPGPGLPVAGWRCMGKTEANVLQLTCPYCGAEADETELAGGGQAHIARQGPDSTDREFENYLFLRDNPAGIHLERWRHAFGCGKWFHAARCTRTHEVFGTYPAQTLEPPDWVRERIKAKRPDWRGFRK